MTKLEKFKVDRDAAFKVSIVAFHVHDTASIEDKDVTYDAFDTARDLYYDLSNAYDEELEKQQQETKGGYLFNISEYM